MGSALRIRRQQMLKSGALLPTGNPVDAASISSIVQAAAGPQVVSAAIGTAVMSKALDNARSQGSALVDMMRASLTPGLGSQVDIRA